MRPNLKQLLSEKFRRIIFVKLVFFEALWLIGLQAVLFVVFVDGSIILKASIIIGLALIIFCFYMLYAMASTSLKMKSSEDVAQKLMSSDGSDFASLLKEHVYAF
jgi:F0F1-type ATP synthase membrane subunit c/vacuolar-type H+-ATPase subunit K